MDWGSLAIATYLTGSLVACRQIYLAERADARRIDWIILTAVALIWPMIVLSIACDRLAGRPPDK